MITSITFMNVISGIQVCRFWELWTSDTSDEKPLSIYYQCVLHALCWRPIASAGMSVGWIHWYRAAVNDDLMRLMRSLNDKIDCSEMYGIEMIFGSTPEVKAFMDMHAYIARLAEHFLVYVAHGKSSQAHLMVGSTHCCLAWRVAVQSWQGFRDRWWWRSPGVVWVLVARLWWWARTARIGQTLNLQMKTKPKAACWPGVSLLRWNLAKVSCISTHPLPHPLGCSWCPKRRPT